MRIQHFTCDLLRCLLAASASSESAKPIKAPPSIPTATVDTHKRKSKKIPTTLDTLSESSTSTPNMDEPQVPAGSKFGEKKGAAKNLPPMNGASSGRGLPPMGAGGLPSLGQGPIGEGRSELVF